MRVRVMYCGLDVDLMGFSCCHKPQHHVFFRSQENVYFIPINILCCFFSSFQPLQVEVTVTREEKQWEK